MKVLILKPSSLGDVVQAIPLLRLIKSRFPESEVYWWLAKELMTLLEGDPQLKKVFPFIRRDWGSAGNLGSMLRTVAETRAIQFDWILDLQGLARSAVFAWLANGATAVGLDNPREGASLAYDVAVPRPGPDSHALDWYLRVLKVMGAPVHWDFDWLPKRAEAGSRVAAQLGGRGDRLVAVCPGARWNTKRWPLEYFDRLLTLISDRDPRIRFAIIGGKEDREMGEILKGSDSACRIDLTGKTSLPEMVEWIRACQMVITNDTGPMHVGAALGIPILGLFGPTDPRQTGPYGQVEHALQLDTLPCIPCKKSTCRLDRPMECLRALTPAFVFERFIEQWDSVSSAA